MRYIIFSHYKRANGQTDETVTVVKNLKTKDLQEGSIILDFKLQQVVKATVDKTPVEKNWDTIVGYYYPHYKAIMERMFTENGHMLPEAEESLPSDPVIDAAISG